MIRYTKESWDEVKTVLEALFYDYTIDLDGNLIVHWENFDIKNEKTGEVVDHVDHLWCKFTFTSYDYSVKFWRSDKNTMSENYMHPHISDSRDEYCSGSYPRGKSLLRDLHYLTSFIGNYNKGDAFRHAEISDFKPTIKVDKIKLQTHLQHTYFFNPVIGIPDVKAVELIGITQEDVLQETELPKIIPTHYFWKEKPIERRWNKPTTSIHTINLKDYKNDKFLKDIITAYNRTRTAQVNAQVS